MSAPLWKSFDRLMSNNNDEGWHIFDVETDFARQFDLQSVFQSWKNWSFKTDNTITRHTRNSCLYQFVTNFIKTTQWTGFEIITSVLIRVVVNPSTIWPWYDGPCSPPYFIKDSHITRCVKLYVKFYHILLILIDCTKRSQ